MITKSQLTLAGKINKTHGIGGEMSISFYTDAIIDAIEPGTCLIMDIDGIFTPFFVRSARPRSSEALLILIDGIDSQEDAAAYTGHSVYMLSEQIADGDIDEDEDDEDGFFAAQLIGFQAVDADGSPIGTIIDIDDSTDNALFVIEKKNDAGTEQILIPIVDDFINDISTDTNSITFDLPEGLLSL